MEENRPVLNITNVGYKPTAVPDTEESDEGISKKQVASISIGSMLVGVLGGRWLTKKCVKLVSWLRRSGELDIETGETESFLSKDDYTLRTSSSEGSLAIDPLLPKGCAEEVSDVEEIQKRIEKALSTGIRIAEDSIEHGTEAIKGDQRPYPENVQAIQDIIEKVQKSVESLNAHKEQDPNITSSALTEKEKAIEAILSTLSKDNQYIIALVRKLREKLEAETIQERVKEALSTVISNAEASINRGTEAIKGDQKPYPENVKKLQAIIEKVQKNVDFLKAHKDSNPADEEDEISRILHTVPRYNGLIDDLIREIEPQAHAESVAHLPPVDSTAGKAVSKLVAISEEEEGKSLLNDPDSDIQRVQQTAPKVVGVLPHTLANTSELHKKLMNEMGANHTYMQASSEQGATGSANSHNSSISGSRTSLHLDSTQKIG